METILKKWGNSIGVRVPSSVLKQVRLTENQRVEISARNGTALIKPLRGRRYSPAELLAGITRKNRHKSIDLGHPAGIEPL